MLGAVLVFAAIATAVAPSVVGQRRRAEHRRPGRRCARPRGCSPSEPFSVEPRGPATSASTTRLERVQENSSHASLMASPRAPWCSGEALTGLIVAVAADVLRPQGWAGDVRAGWSTGSSGAITRPPRRSAGACRTARSGYVRRHRAGRPRRCGARSGSRLLAHRRCQLVVPADDPRRSWPRFVPIVGAFVAAPGRGADRARVERLARRRARARGGHRRPAGRGATCSTRS